MVKRCPQINDPIPDYHLRLALISSTRLMTDADYQCVDIHVCFRANVQFLSRQDCLEAKNVTDLISDYQFRPPSMRTYDHVKSRLRC